ncbi:hypothetical protein VaNZ11_006399 [Volvox africanus]|uniref:4Fe-4S ferredoxin-type domain-containing protein n=1 Tax=Volvox africanus TaxID=51714 RepID=A0ABQ5S1Q7_9CHLO|nr:hypothetical protein VaNZ11_006399 [Volvox africanus]
MLHVQAHAAAGADTAPAAAVVATAAVAVQDERIKAAVQAEASIADGQAVCGAVHTMPAIPYKSPIRRRTARIKIPFAEPEEIAPGYVERLQALVAQRGCICLGFTCAQLCPGGSLGPLYPDPKDANPITGTHGWEGERRFRGRQRNESPGTAAEEGDFKRLSHEHTGIKGRKGISLP